jgi:hypothetical protein
MDYEELIAALQDAAREANFSKERTNLEVRFMDD